MSTSLNQKLSSLINPTHFEQENVQGLQGQTAVVTGATAGIGFEVAKTLALAGARTILLSRKIERGEEAISKITELAREKGIKVDISFKECDLGDLNNVRQVADTLRSIEERIDLLICDAGVGVNKYSESLDGIDRHFAVNVLGHVLLINRLLPLIRKTARLPNVSPPRIVTVSSSLHQTASSQIQFKSEGEINDPSMGPNALYARSKLAVILYTRFGLVERVIKPGNDAIFALSSHPGVVQTQQQDQFKESYGKIPGTILKYTLVPFMRTPEEGSLSTLWAATSPDVLEKNLQGTYVQDPGQWGGETQQAQDDQLGKNLWNLCHTIIQEKLGSDCLLGWNEATP